jgi:hypothetical protein
MGNVALSGGKNGWSLTLVTNPHLAPKLRTSKAKHLLHLSHCYGTWVELYLYLLFVEVALTLASGNNRFLVNYTVQVRPVVNMSVIQGGYFLLQVI